jgi:hypothetical protein
MSKAQVKNPVVVTEATPASQIQGRLDAIEGRRIFGWVWDRTHPAERILVRILLDGRMVASAVADLPRIDLRRSGIGDGAHAFEVELPEMIASTPDNLTIVAFSRATSEEVVLRNPSMEEKAVEAAVSAPLHRVIDRIELLIEAQRRSQAVQRETVEVLRGTSKQVGDIVGQEDGISAAIDLVRASQNDLSGRVADIEVFHLRFDKVLADFDEKVRELSTAADRPMRRAVSILVALGGLTAASALTTLVILLRSGSF